MEHMSNSGKEKVLIIVNPISGVKGRNMEEFMTTLDDFLDKTKYETEYRISTYPGHAVEICRAGQEEGVRIFVAAGGDGTVNEVGSVITGTDAIMGIIPAGSGNGLAHHLSIPGKVKEAIDLINEKKVLSIDTCRANEIFFVSIAGMGFDARVARQYAKSGHRGFKTYALIAFKEYFNYKTRKYLLKMDGREHKVSAFFISFANSNQFGYNARIAPNASLTDGQLDICVVKKPPVQAFPGIAHMMFTRKIDRSKYMDIFRASHIVIERNKGKTVNIDGEAIRLPKKIEIRVVPKSLNVIVP
jgi:YegS/Rv2252/BmrU family lipid kinase